MKTHKINFLLPFFALTLILPQYSFAAYKDNQSGDEPLPTETVETPPEESRLCNITATVHAIQQNTDHPDYYDVRVEITGINASGTTAATACDKEYATQIERAGQILKVADYLEQNIKENDNIKAEVQFTRSGELTGYFLNGIQIVEQTVATSQGQTSQTATAVSGETKSEKESSIMSFIKAFSLITIAILAFMVYSSRDKLKKS